MNLSPQEQAKRERDAFAEVLHLMGFDVQKLAKLATNQEEAYWKTVMFSSVRIELDHDLLTANCPSLSENERGGIAAVFAGVRQQEKSHV
ncbi:hypothetical protein [Burkholderia cenocepacia]|uniref:hypothetical protein n=1 Tax=Burkholderia cenocepacia TaxID=95486 RepID=UPI002ABD1434|nr:hypothetical protein [Burkholderia cenocepacia]